MSSPNLDVYMPIIILMAIGVIAVVGALLVGKLIRPHNPNALKESPYECGEEPIGSAWSNFNVRFYVVSLIFIIFDVEGALMFPVAAVFRRFNEIGEGGVLLGSLLLFILVLVLGIVYCWKKGDLDWVKSFQLSDEQIKQLNNVKES
ncbi:MAG: NADH-quinone oxidoreductase subunit A [Oligoflexia bacterium]|nr:NADH-quinone oxidoreductase subunit A [Oligoflexia bacterium]